MRNNASRLTRLMIFCTATVALAARISFAQENSQDAATPVYDLKNAGENGITLPKAISTPNPEYTDSARKKKIRGTVGLSLIITPDGTVRDPKITQSLDKDLDQQALSAVSRWTFKPATKDGQPVSVRINAEVSFNIR